MKLITINLINQFQRPVVNIGKTLALIDTGALIPTISLGKEAIEELNGVL